MATVARVPVETYLRSVYRPDVDYVDGVIEERNLGEEDHSKWQLAIQLWFAANAEAWDLVVRPELRVNTSSRHYRVADVTILDASQPRERIPTWPPLAVFEVLSPEDRLSRVKERLADFAAMGVPEIWLVTPETGSFDRFENGDLIRREHFEIAERGIAFDVDEIRKRVR